ncbi:MAG: hypothetical protein R6W84_18315 [Promethearchaeia archaeon]
MKIKFTNPELLNLSKSSETFDSLFLKDIKENLAVDNERLEINIDCYGDTNLIEYIKIISLQTIEEYNYITHKIVDLLSKVRESVITSKIERKFYSKNDELLCVVNYLDFNRVNITFVNPDQFKLEKSSKIFKNIFSEKIISDLKQKNPEIKINYNLHENSEIIESIDILNIGNISNYNYICEKLMELLSEKAVMQ